MRQEIKIFDGEWLTTTGWWLSLPLWKMIEFVSWDDYSIPNWMESHKIPWFQTTNQIISHLKQTAILEYPLVN